MHDLIIKGATVVTPDAAATGDIAIAGGRVAGVGRDLGPARREIAADGLIAMPGGVDGHCHIEQLSAAGIMNADTFESASRAALLGGTTSVISFAAQHVGMNLATVVADYGTLAARGAMVDHAFHMILADPTPETLARDLPPLVAAGHTSIKVFMTYDRLRLDDEKLLEVLAAARAQGCLVTAHCENHGLIQWLSRTLLARGDTHPRFHAVAHAREAEIEAIHRLIGFAEMLGQPVMIFHVSTAEGAAAIRAARARGAPITAETCPQYLFLTGTDLDRPHAEAARLVFSPPPRSQADQAALWAALADGTLDLVSSDHAPYRPFEGEKLRRGAESTFREIVSGLPGLLTRLPLLFDALVSAGRGSLNDFARLTAENPARAHGLAPRKGAIVVGADADITLWDPSRKVTLADGPEHGGAGYTPFAGRQVTGWPLRVFLRGHEVMHEGEVPARPGDGAFLPRVARPAQTPSN
jgi:dihydropyrimidinase